MNLIETFKDIIWPESNKVVAYFGIVGVTIIVLALYFMFADAVISELIKQIY